MVEVLDAARSEQDQRRVAGAMLAAGLRAGDRVVFVTESSALMLSAILGALRVGIVPVPLNPALLDRERSELFADAEPALVVDDRVLVDLVEGPPADLAPHPMARPMHYTSGTTGRAKGVWSGLLSEREARDLVEEEAELWSFEASDVHLVCSPLHHSVSIRFGGGTLLAGGSVVVPGRFDARVVTEVLRRLRPTTTFMVPAHLQRLLGPGAPTGSADCDVDLHRGPDLSSLRLLAHAGAPCPEDLKRRAVAACRPEVVREFYGSTEGQFTVCTAEEWQQRPGTVGRARPGRGISTDGDGLIWCRPPAHARWEYWRDPVRTEAAWSDGAFTVGDLGRLDDDGYLYIEGRRSDLIITGGVNVYPAEVEQVLAGAPGVVEVAVFGVEDERWGQMVCAAVVGEVAPGRVMAHARENLAPYKCPKQVHVLDSLPRTSTGKLRRLELPGLLGLPGSG